MNLIKLKFSNSNTDSTLTGNGTSSEPFGINFNGITGLEPYSERLLFSAELSGVSSIDLSEPKNHFERLRFVIGARNWSNNGLESKEFGTEPNNIHLNFQNGAGGNAYWVGTYGTWTNQTHLDVTKSKNVYGSYSNANITGNLTYTADDINCIKAVYGVNPKPIRTLHVIDGVHGTISADISAGLAGDVCTLSNTPDEGWYFSGYNITGATLTGNQFMFGNSDVTVEAVWSDTPMIKTLTLQTDGHGTLTANNVTGFEGDTVTLSNNHADYYRFKDYTVTGGTINGNTYTFGTAQEQTAKANFTANKFTITGNYNYAQTTYTANWDAKVRSIAGKDVPTSWGTVGNNFNPGSCSAYGLTFKTTMNGWYERGSSTAVLVHKIAGTFVKSGQVTGYGSYSNYTNSVTVTGTSTKTGHPTVSARINCTYDKHTNGMPTNGWTATGYIK